MASKSRLRRSKNLVLFGDFEAINPTQMKRKSKDLKGSQVAGKRKSGIARNILKRPPAGSLLLGTLSFKWTTEKRTVPNCLRFSDWINGVTITAGDVALEVTASNHFIFKTYFHLVYWVFNEKTTNTELFLDVYPKFLPMHNAEFLVENIFGKQFVSPARMEENQAWDGLIKELVTVHGARNYSSNVAHADMRATLRGYQASAVAWMLERESSEKELKMDWMAEVADFLNVSGQSTMLFNKYTGTVFESFQSTQIRTGGILADEMGLGKTVITLALILNNPRLSQHAWEVEKLEIDCESDYDSEDDRPLVRKRQANRENTLDANEKLLLVPSKPGKGILKRQLTAWYESQLAAITPKQRTRNSRRSRPRFKCTCGDEIGSRARKIVQCVSCRLKQHSECVGFRPEFEYLCPECWKMQKQVPSRATLIVTPPAIFQQWAHEIENHTPTLKTLLYSGVREKFVQPTFMADFDIVVTTFPVLRNETTYGLETPQRSLRNESRFLRQTCPLEYVDWWRVVCDEAQMFESDASLIRVMVNRLNAVHRWCVTGTPIQKGIADLFYLTSFMGIGPFDDKKIWTEFLLVPYLSGCKTPLLSILGEVFWRSTKEQVESELAIPEQTFDRHLLNFSAIEAYFYALLHEKCAVNFSERLRKAKINGDTILASLDKSTMKKLLEPLLKLRQACTHAQIVSGININRAGKVSTITELLDYLCKKTKIECDDALREHVGAINGIAGLHWLEENYESAVENYRKILRLSEEITKGDVHVDTLQLIHTMTNLAILLDEHPGCAAPTLRDDKLREEVNTLEKKYLGKPRTALEASVQESKAVATEIQALFESFEMSPMTWWMPVLLAMSDFESEVLFRVNEQIDTNDFREKKDVQDFLNSIKSIRDIEVVIRNWWSEIEECHRIATKGVKNLIKIDCDQLVDDALECHLRNTKREKCGLCRVENQLLDLECQLFATSRKKLGKKEKVMDGAGTRGSWKPSRPETLLTIVVNFAKSRTQLDPVLLTDRNKHTKLIESIKKQFKHLRAVWTALNNCVHAQDELSMAKWRLRFAEPWERIKKTSNHPELALALSLPEEAQKLHIIYPEQVSDMMAVLESNSAFSVYQRKRGKLFYLENLRKRDTTEHDPCPICQNELKDLKSVLPCGHSFCLKCLESLRGGSSRVNCPVCRQSAVIEEIVFFEDKSNKTTNADSQNEEEIVSQFSAKVDSVVTEVMRLLNDDERVKILVFSTWGAVLKILSEALTNNKIVSLSLPSPKHQKILDDFRDMRSGVSVLLLPLAWGSKGLNLVEATHVFLIEPILNPAEELQAIGRVHRIGQTRPTVVHRFIMKKTIEEKIFEAVSEAKDMWTKKKATLDDLKNLFVQLIGSETN